MSVSPIWAPTVVSITATISTDLIPARTTPAIPDHTVLRVIGSGSTGVQLVTELSRRAATE